jgi:hypothetical protein
MQAQRRHPLPAYSFWETYFKHGLEEAGHEWVEAAGIDWVEPLVTDDPRLVQRTWQRAIDYIRQLQAERPIDLFLGYFFPKQIDPAGVRAVRDLGIPTVNFFCDNVRDFRVVPTEFRAFDLHWVPEFKALVMYRDAGLNVVHAAMPVWVAPERRTCDHPERYGPTFIGRWDLQRDDLFGRAIQLGAPLVVRGPGWRGESSAAQQPAAAASWTRRLSRLAKMARTQGPLAPLWRMTYTRHRELRGRLPAAAVDAPVFGDDYVAVTQQSMVTIGTNRYPSFRRPFWNPDTYSRLRDIEAPVMGACYLTEWTEGLDQMYELGREIETYRTAEELVEQISRLSADATRRTNLRLRGQQRALADHCVGRSISAIGEALGIDRRTIATASKSSA